MNAWISGLTSRIGIISRRPSGRLVAVVLALVALAAPSWLFADSLAFRRLQLDDFSFVGASRTLAKTRDNLFVPHNAHIVPAWRLLTWGLVAMAGSLRNVPDWLGMAATVVVPMVMMAVGVIVKRETNTTSAALAAMAFAGITSILKAPATWYSAGQTYWAGLGILLTLIPLQSWKKSGGAWRLALSAAFAILAGGFWTIGHASGPAGAAYLWADGRPRARRAALVPLLASVFAVAVSFGLGAKKIEVEVRFEGGDRDKAMSVRRGASHTLQSISETLVLGNLGVAAETSPTQAIALTAAVLAFWGWTFRNGGRPSPLECTGGTIVLIGYLVSWTFRGYYEWVNLRGVVPWYDTIPHLGAVLFVSGWWGRVWNPGANPRPLTVGGSLGVLALILGLVAVHQPRVNRMFLNEVPKMTEAEARSFPIESLQLLRARFYANLLIEWHKNHLYRLDRAEVEARRLGIGRDLIRKAFGRVEAPGLPEAYDAAEMLDLPAHGRATDIEIARRALGPLFVLKPPPEFPLQEVLSRRR